MTFLNNFFFAFSLFVTIFRALCIDYFVSKLTKGLRMKVELEDKSNDKILVIIAQFQN